MATVAASKCGVLLCDVRPAFRVGIAAALATDLHFELAGEASSADEAIAIASSGSSQIAMVDTGLPPIGGLALIRELRARFSISVLGIADTARAIAAATLLGAGAGGLALRSQPVAEIVDALHHVRAGNRYLPPSLAVDQVESAQCDPPLAKLTRREREIFELLVRGVSNGAIAQQLFISTRTVESHRQRVMHKLGAHAIVDLLRVAIDVGVLDVGQFASLESTYELRRSTDRPS